MLSQKRNQSQKYVIVFSKYLLNSDIVILQNYLFSEERLKDKGKTEILTFLVMCPFVSSIHLTNSINYMAKALW